MNASNFECPICHETLLDPRALPCGHDYCGKVNGLDKPCIDYLLRDGVVTCAMDTQEFENLKLSDLRTHITLRDTIEDYKRNKRHKCPTHVNNNLDMVCLTCGEKKICTSCLRDHQEHKVISAADHLERKMAGIDTELEEKTSLLEQKLANRNKALEKLTRLTEDVRRDREEISQSLEKLRSLKLQSQQFRETGQLTQSEDVEAYLEAHRSVQLKHGVDLHTVKKACQEVVQLLVIHDKLASPMNPTTIYPVLEADQEPSAPPLAQLPDDSYPSSSSVVSVTSDIGSSRSAPESSGAVKEFSAEHSIRPQFTSAREVATIEGGKCFSCVDDLIFVSTKNPCHVIKYRWEESGGKISINEVKRSATIESGRYGILLAAAKTQGRVRLYVCNNDKKTVERFDPDSLKRLNTLNTNKLDSRTAWCIAAWDDVLAVSDQHVIAMYKNDQLVSTVPYKHGVCDIRLSSTFLATRNAGGHIRVMRWAGDRLDTTPVYTIDGYCWGLAMSERQLMTADWGKVRLMALDLTTMEERQLQSDVGGLWPHAFARDDLVVGRDMGTNELTMVQLS